MSLNATPSGERVHIAFFGRRNAGKSSLVNAVTGQELSVVSPTAGTTTDPVRKAMELLPLGPVVILDTPGFDDEGSLGQLRVRRTRQTLNRTDIAGALRYLTNAIRKRSTAFIISDFLDDGFDKELQIANRKHDIAALQVYDVRETELPDVGLIKLKDAETGERLWVDTGDRRLRLAYRNHWNERQLELQKAFVRAGVDWVSMSTADDYVRALLSLFKRRA